MSGILEAIWAALNSPLGIAAVAAGLLWLLNKLYAWRPAWRDWEGTIIAAVKFAEKQIPDDAGNTAVARLDAALKYVLQVYAEAEGKRASPKVERELREGVQIVHADLEAVGTVGGKSGNGGQPSGTS